MGQSSHQVPFLLSIANAFLGFRRGPSPYPSRGVILLLAARCRTVFLTVTLSPADCTGVEAVCSFSLTLSSLSVLSPCSLMVICLLPVPMVSVRCVLL